ncbi:MAG: carboxypeptidase-like regulatory domain-containing protein [Paludibacteraceae bacterium]|nr:carboxypeptidase-like regulatory domain-containing protein [Paludibacteraceae bacterium]
MKERGIYQIWRKALPIVVCGLLCISEYDVSARNLRESDLPKDSYHYNLLFEQGTYTHETIAHSGTSSSGQTNTDTEEVTPPDKRVTYMGRVRDTEGRAISFATVYPIAQPEAGTATNDSGVFVFSCNLPGESEVVISFIGYEKQTVPLSTFAKDTTTITLIEQPIKLEETVVSAKKTKHKNKRKEMAYLLHQVYMQMEADFSDDPFESRIVSDVKMDSQGEAWGMEQMIARMVTLPEQAKKGKDSVQLQGQFCKRYFDPAIRQLADTILASGELDKKTRRFAAAVDSGVTVHRALWAVANARYDLKEATKDLRHWEVKNENDGETVLTHTDKKDFLGIYKMVFSKHFILDSETLSIKKYSQQLEVWVNIPFGMKLKGEQLQLLNLLNMGEEKIEKFRLKKMHSVIQLNCIYQRTDGHLYPLEKNLYVDGTLTSSKKMQMEIPVSIRATQRAIQTKTHDVNALRRDEMTRRMRRVIVEIY